MAQLVLRRRGRRSRQWTKQKQKYYKFRFLSVNGVFYLSLTLWMLRAVRSESARIRILLRRAQELEQLFTLIWSSMPIKTSLYPEAVVDGR